MRYLVDMIGSDRLLIGTDFPAMPRERPAGATMRGLDLPDATLDDITWHDTWRFLGLTPPETP